MKIQHQQRKTRKPQKLAWATLGLLLLLQFQAAVFSQVRLEVGDEFPENPKVNDWFFDPMGHEIWHRVGDQWKLFTQGACYEVELCHDLLFLNYRGTMDVVTASGEWLNAYVPYLWNCKCLDSLMLWETINSTYFVDIKGNTLAWVQNRNLEIPLDTMGAQTGFSVPEFVLDTLQRLIADRQVNTWGFLGTNAHWLIEPKYDGPFYFQNGVAEVLYYGQKRKINAKGEFVE